MEEITIKKRKYRIMQIALIVTSIILLIITIDWFANLKYYAMLKNFGFYNDAYKSNDVCAMLGDARGEGAYIMWVMCCESYSSNCSMRVLSCLDVKNLGSCQVDVMKISSSGKELIKLLGIDKQ